MVTFLVVNGPNLDMLGARDRGTYGSLTLPDLEGRLRQRGQELGVELRFCQSSFEGELVNFINQNAAGAQGIIINPAGLTLAGYALLDSCIDSGLPAVEVHLSNIGAREEWRSRSIFSRAARATVSGMRWMGYMAALDFLAALIKEEV